MGDGVSRRGSRDLALFSHLILLDNAIRNVRDRATTETDEENVDTVSGSWVGASLRSSSRAAGRRMANHLKRQMGATSMRSIARWCEAYKPGALVGQSGRAISVTVGDIAREANSRTAD